MKAEAWQLTHEALRRLLDRLDPDPEAAGAAYEELRLRLRRFFSWRGAAYPDECTDVTLNRVARKLCDGEEVFDVHRYAVGVARLVLLEEARAPRPALPLEERDLARAGAPAPEGEREELHAHLERCLAALPDEGRALILRYYLEERGAKIDNRQRLAAELGLSANALRSRALRVRERLERCLEEREQLPGRGRGTKP